MGGSAIQIPKAGEEQQAAEGGYYGRRRSTRYGEHGTPWGRNLPPELAAHMRSLTGFDDASLKEIWGLADYLRAQPGGREKSEQDLWEDASSRWQEGWRIRRSNFGTYDGERRHEPELRGSLQKDAKENRSRRPGRTGTPAEGIEMAYDDQGRGTWTGWEEDPLYLGYKEEQAAQRSDAARERAEAAADWTSTYKVDQQLDALLNAHEEPATP